MGHFNHNCLIAGSWVSTGLGPLGTQSQGSHHFVEASTGSSFREKGNRFWNSAELSVLQNKILSSRGSTSHRLIWTTMLYTLLCPWDFAGKNTGVGISSSTESSWPRDQTCISCISHISKGILHYLATQKALSDLGEGQWDHVSPFNHHVSHKAREGKGSETLLEVPAQELRPTKKTSESLNPKM